MYVFRLACPVQLLVRAQSIESTHPPPPPPNQMTRRLHELLPLGLQHALRDRYLGSAFDGGVKAAALLVGLRYPTAVLK